MNGAGVGSMDTHRRWIVVLIAAAISLGVSGCAGTDAARADGQPLVLVAGATGGTGQAVVNKALERGLRVRVLVRDAEKGRSLFDNRVSYATGDVREPRSLRAAMRGVQYVISTLGSSGARDPENSPERVDYLGVKALAEAAKASAVEHVVLTSSMGVTNPDHQLNRILDNVLQWKLKGEDALRATGVNYTIVRPGGLTNDDGGTHGLKVMQGDPQDVAGRISREDLAAVLVNALGRKDAYGKTFEVIGDPDSASVEWDTLYAELKPDVR
jgi:uncharacterized protein YbjT (DUF2867 family)